jgi:hypothetical protein
MGAGAWPGRETPMYDAGLALIDLSNRPVTVVEGAYDGSVECQ